MADHVLDRPLVGFRTWLIDRAVPTKLLAVTWYTPWSEVNEAVCAYRHVRWQPELYQHPAPAPNCTCGLYAYDSLATATAHVDHPRRPSGYVSVLGAVLLWGAPGRPVRMGELVDGGGLRYRAPFARVLALLDAGPPTAAVRAVAEAHAIPLLPATGLELYAREHGVRRRAEEVARC